jgi:hypothetical protein
LGGIELEGIVSVVCIFVPHSGCPSRMLPFTRKCCDLLLPSLPRPSQPQSQPRNAGSQADPSGRKGAPHGKAGDRRISELPCSYDSAYQRRPVSVAARRRDALFSEPAKDTKLLHVPVDVPGIRRLITALRASDRCCWEPLYFQMSPWCTMPRGRTSESHREEDQRLAAGDLDPHDQPGWATEISTPRNPGQVLECAKPIPPERTWRRSIRPWDRHPRRHCQDGQRSPRQPKPAVHKAAPS